MLAVPVTEASSNRINFPFNSFAFKE